MDTIVAFTAPLVQDDIAGGLHFFRHYEARILQELLNRERASYDGTNMRMRLPDPLHDDDLRELIVAWTLQPPETQTINGHPSSGAAT